MKTKKNFTGRPNGSATESRSGTAQPAHRSDVEGSVSKRTRILIVEDEPAMVAGLRDNFEYEGYDVISAGDGVAGLERALADDPDLVVLDVMMPRMSGLDVCKQLKAKTAVSADHHADRARPGDRQGCGPGVGRR